MININKNIQQCVQQVGLLLFVALFAFFLLTGVAQAYITLESCTIDCTEAEEIMEEITEELELIASGYYDDHTLDDLVDLRNSLEDHVTDVRAVASLEGCAMTRIGSSVVIRPSSDTCTELAQEQSWLEAQLGDVNGEIRERLR